MKKIIATTMLITVALFSSASFAGKYKSYRSVGSSVYDSLFAPGRLVLDAVLVSKNGCGKIVSYRGTTPKGNYSVNGKIGIIPVTITVDRTKKCNARSNLIRKIIPISNVIGNKSAHTLRLYFVDTQGRIIKTESLGVPG